MFQFSSNKRPKRMGLTCMQLLYIHVPDRATGVPVITTTTPIFLKNSC